MENVRALEPFQQWGAMAVVAGLLLLLVAGMFKLFVKHALKTNGELLEKNFELQKDMLLAISTMTAASTSTTNAVKDLAREVRDLDNTIGNLFNEVSSMTGNSRGYSIKPRSR